MIEIKNVKKSFGSNLVLSDLNLTIEKGSIFGLIGINGAGKSTLLRLISGVYKADSGSITLDGEVIYENSKIKSRIFFLPDDPYFSYRVTGEDLKSIYMSYYDFDNNLFYQHLEKFKLDSKKQIHNYSKGMKRQLYISLALACRPEYILLDEAFDGLDPLARLYFKRMLIDLTITNNTTVIISSHALRELEDICDSYGIIDHNTIISSGNIDDELAKIYKYQLAFKDEVSKEMIRSVEVISFVKESKLTKISFRGNKEKFIEEIEKLSPLFIDEIQVSFEDIFIDEIESRGYLK